MRTIWQVVFVISFFTAACSGGNTGPVFDVSDQDKIKKVIEQLTEAFNAKDAKKAAALYTPEAVVMPPNKTLSRGRNFVEQYYMGRFAEGASDLTLTPSEIKGSGNLAVAMATSGSRSHRRRGHRSAIGGSSSGSSASRTTSG